jgi:23S rRNA G2069 N7-methylase RlmK/C1962 C5-methylase RlmI
MYEGEQLFAVTQTTGYGMAVDYFETYINEQIRAKSLNQDEAAGIQKVFDYFDQGESMFEASRDNIRQYESEPE